jgi:hypothetical protein
MSDNLNDVKNPNKISCVNSCLLSLPPKQFAALSTIFGLLLLDDLSIDQQSALGNFLLSVGQTILTASAQAQSLESCNSQNNQVRDDIEDLKKQIALLKKDHL